MLVTKEQALEAFEGSQTSLARALGIRYQAIQGWKSGQPIPRGRQWDLHRLLPDKIPAPPPPSADAPAQTVEHAQREAA